MWKYNRLWQCQKLLRSPSQFLDRELLLKSKKNFFVIRNQTNASNATNVIPRHGRSRGDEGLSSYGVFLLVVPIGSFALGCWQVQRKKWKENLIEEVEYRTTLVPVSLPEDLSDLSELEYRPVRVRGTFDHSREIFLGPRSLIINGDSVSNQSLLSSQDVNKTGFLVITPFKLSNREETILVNRGWVPSSKRDPRARFAGQVEGEVEIEGIIRLTETRAPFMPENKNPHMWAYRDINKMAKHLNASPVFLDAKVESSIPGGPVGGQTRVTLRNEHLSYIITWYGLTIGTGYMWYKKFIRKT